MDATAASSCRGSKRSMSRFPPTLRRTADRIRAGAWATLWTALLVAAIVVGSRNLQNFDRALVIYTFAVIFADMGRGLPLQRLAAKSRPRASIGIADGNCSRRRGIFRSLGR